MSLRSWNPFPAFETRLDAERDQLALWLPVALGSGIALWFLIPAREGWIACMMVSGGLSLAIGGTFGAMRTGRALAIALAALALGTALIWWRAERVAHPTIGRPAVVRFVARVEQVEDRPAFGTVRLLLAADAGQGVPDRVRINVDRAMMPKPADPAIAAGARIMVRARLVPPPEAALPGAYDFARVAWFRQIGATGRALDPPVLVERPGRWAGATWLADVRHRLGAHVQSRLPGSAGGIATALLTGDKGAIHPEDSDAMRTSGLAHLLAISGLHVGIVVGGAMLCSLRLLALSRWMALHLPLPMIAAGIAALTGISYTLIAGAQVPTVRSCIAALLVLGALAIGREAITLRLVAAGALLVLLFLPEALVGPSFQLSFAAVATLVALHELPWVRRLLDRREEGAARRFARSVAGLLLSGLAIEIALTPIVLYHFHKAGIYGAMANMVAIPLTTFVIMPMEVLALAADVVGAGAPFWYLTGLALNALIAMAHWVSGLPGALRLVPAIPVASFALMVVGAAWVLLWRGGWRLWGLGPVLLGMGLAVVAPAPDLFVTGDGRHLAIRNDRGMILLRPRAGDYVRQTLGEVGGRRRDYAIDGAPGAQCSADLCVVRLDNGMRLAATRSRYHLDWRALVRVCGMVDIMVSDRRLPRDCRPAWLRIDPQLLRRTGGLAIDLDRGRVIATRARHDDHPWMRGPSERSGAGHVGGDRGQRESDRSAVTGKGDLDAVAGDALDLGVDRPGFGVQEADQAADGRTGVGFEKGAAARNVP